MTIMKISVLFCFSQILPAFFCKGQVPAYSSFPKFDVHFHINSYHEGIRDLLQEHNFIINSVAVGSESRSRTQKQNDYSFSAKKNAHDRIVVTTAFSMEGFNRPGWASEVIDTLSADFRKAVVGVKIWKDIGMTYRRPDSSFVMIDDPEFDAILAFIEDQGKTLLIHAGEPKNCWLPVEKMTVNNDKHYFSSHPQYQDRIIYGSDLGFSVSPGETLNENNYKRWLDEWEYFATDKILRSTDVNNSFRGLKLQTDVLRKIYFDNAKKWLGGL